MAPTCSIDLLATVVAAAGPSAAGAVVHHPDLLRGHAQQRNHLLPGKLRNRDDGDGARRGVPRLRCETRAEIRRGVFAGQHEKVVKRGDRAGRQGIAAAAGSDRGRGPPRAARAAMPTAAGAHWRATLRPATAESDAAGNRSGSAYRGGQPPAPAGSRGSKAPPRTAPPRGCRWRRARWSIHSVFFHLSVQRGAADAQKSSGAGAFAAGGRQGG